MKQGNLYFDVLKWASTRISKGVTYSEFKEFVDDRSAETLSDVRAKSIFRTLFVPVSGASTQMAVTDAIRDNLRFHLTVEAAFRHLEITELEHARQSSSTATWIAIAAILISIVVGLADNLNALFC